LSLSGALLEKLPDVNLDLPSSISAPRLFIVNCQLPSEAPSLLSSADDGPGYVVAGESNVRAHPSGALLRMLYMAIHLL
jgi:hypothetical protein